MVIVTTEIYCTAVSCNYGSKTGDIIILFFGAKYVFVWLKEKVTVKKICAKNLTFLQEVTFRSCFAEYDMRRLGSASVIKGACLQITYM